VTAQVEVPDGGANGVIVAQGGVTGGWSLYAHDAKLVYVYNFFGLHRYYVRADAPIGAGSHQVRMEFAYDGGGLAKGGTVTLYLDGDTVASGRVEHTEPILFSADETCDVGAEFGSPVSGDYGPRENAFTGTVRWVEIDIGDAAQSDTHELTHEQRFHVAMGVQ